MLIIYNHYEIIIDDKYKEKSENKVVRAYDFKTLEFFVNFDYKEVCYEI